MHFYAFMRLCVVLPLYHALAPCVVHGIGVHVMHHIIIVVIIMMFMMFMMFIMMIIDHHDVYHSLIDHC